ncbi:MAG: DNA polymerase I [Planctomycetes bacterium]|nr:DNA polymerase I [Planctomycetota bacterium]
MSKTTKKLYIIDGHAHIYSAYYAPMRPLTSPGGEPTKVGYVFTNMLLGLIDRAKPDMLVVTMDSKGPCFRADIYPEYKAHRKPMPEDMPVQIDRVVQIVEALGIPVLKVKGFEADDLIGTLARKASAKGIDTYICSKDKDMLQLLDEHVRTYDVKKKMETTPESLQEDMGVTPAQFLDVLALQGDTADNVPGVADVGPKTALTWIQKYGSIENLYEHAAEIKGKRGDSLRASREVVDLSKRLVTIDCDSPVELDEESFALSEPDKDKLVAIFKELGFTKFVAKFGGEVAEKKKAAPKKKTNKAQGMLFGGGDDEISEERPAGPYDTIETVKKDYVLVDTAEKFDAFYSDLKKQKIFAVDTETTSLNAMAADLVGLSFCWEKSKAYYLPVRGPMGQRPLDVSMVREKLSPIFADEKIKKIGQNIKYDMLILEVAKMPLKGVYFDTMVASYCLNAERRSHSMDNMARDFLNYECVPISDLIGKGKKQITFDMVDIETAYQYAAEDADITFRLYEYLSALLDKEPAIRKLFDELEMPLVPVLAQMEINGVSLDVKLLKNMSHDLAETVEGLQDEIFKLAGEEFNLDSPKQLGDILFDKLGLESVRSGKTTRSTDAAVLEQLESKHEIIPHILQYRQLTKLRNTYVDKLGDLINPRTNRVHCSFNQTITATGRLSSSDPNLQNIPIRTELGRKIRAAFVPADTGSCIISADYSQVELRLLADFSGDPELCRAFTADEDIHRFVASQVYGVSPEEVTGEMRSHSKAVNFGIIYGQGAFGLARSIGVTRGEAQKFIDDYFARYGSIRKFMDDTIDKVKKTGYAETILGRRRAIDGLDSKNFNLRSQAERLAINTVIQGSAADLIKVAMINIEKRIDEEKLPIKMILQIHDELVFEVPKAQEKLHEKWIKEEMESAIKLNIPLKVDAATGPNWMVK